MTIVPSLKNINFMSQNRFNSLADLSEEELYAVNIGSVLTTNSMNNSANGYMRLGNGIIIQWGTGTANSTLTFPAPFLNTNYKMCTTQRGHTDNTLNVTIESQTTTSVYVGKYGINSPFDWIAIGRWN